MSGIINVALEKNEAPWPLGMDKRPLGFRQFGSSYADDECAPGGHGRRLARPNREGQPQRLRNPLLIPLDNALAASSPEVTAELGGFFGRTEGPNHGTVINALLAEIGTPDQR